MKLIPKKRGLDSEGYYYDRQKGLGGSDIAAILGFDKWKSIMGIYQEKTAPFPGEQEMPLAAEVGLELEQMLRRRFAKWFKEEHGVEINVERESKYKYAHDDYDFFLANIDGKFKNPLMDDVYNGLEIKTAGLHAESDWDDDKIPDNYYLQVQWYLLITGWPKFYVIGLIGNNILKHLEILPNPEVFELMTNSAKDFWYNFVGKKVMPGPTGLSSDAEILEKLFPNAVAKSKVELDYLGDLYDEYKDLRKQEKEISRKIELIKQKVMFEMKNNEVAYIKNHKVIWKNIEGGNVSYYRKPKRRFVIY